MDNRKLFFRNTLLSLALAVTVLASACAATPSKDKRARSHHELATFTAVDTVSVKSAKMGRDIKAVVVLPRQYGNASKRFPVLYLLHGAGGSYKDWPGHVPDLADKASQRGGMIIVCPDGQNSWYFDSPIDPKFQFETFVSRELVDYIDGHYRTVPDSAHRAITGLSMGGHGALWIGFRHPATFASCGSMSGGVNFVRFSNNWDIYKRLGRYDENKQLWERSTVLSLVPSLKPGQSIIVDDGTEDFFYKDNMDLHHALVEHKIPHDFIVRPGAHTWQYWVNSLDYQLLFFSKAFEKTSKR